MKLNKSDIKLLASAPTLEKIKELIANYWYTKPEEITLVQKAETLWSVYQNGDIKYLESQGKIHENGLVKMSDNYVEFKKGRYRFMYSPVKSNPVKDSSSKAFETWENEKARLEEMVNEVSSALKRVTGDNKGGLTPDHIKESSVYKNAKNKFNIAFERLRKFNQNSPKEFVKLATLKRRESRKQNPIKVKKGPREYGVRSGAKLNLSQAMEIRDNDYRTRDAQHDYDPESVNDRIYELQQNKAEKEQQRAVIERNEPDLVGSVMWANERDGRGIILGTDGNEWYFDSSVTLEPFHTFRKKDKVGFTRNKNIKDIRAARNVKKLNGKIIFEDLEKFYDYFDALSKELNFNQMGSNEDKLFLYFRPNFDDLNSGEDWLHVYAFEDVVVKTIGGIVVAIAPDRQSGNIRVEYLLPRNLRSEADKEKAVPVSMASPERNKPIKIRIPWLDNEHGPTYAYLQLPDFPFCTVRIFPYKDKAFKVSLLIDGVIQSEKLFKGLTHAINYAEREFLRMCSVDPDYIVSIKSNPYLLK